MTDEHHQLGTRHPRAWRWGFGLGVLIIAIASGSLVVPSIDRRSTTPSERGDEYGERADAAATMDDSRTSAGTSGRDLGVGSGQAVAGGPLLRLQALTESEDLTHLVGRNVRFVVDTPPLPTEVAFWVGDGDGKLLVVLDRDRRSSTQRQLGSLSEHQLVEHDGRGPVIVAGVIERIPYAEATYSWNLSRSDAQEVLKRKVYVRAASLLPASNGAAHQ